MLVVQICHTVKLVKVMSLQAIVLRSCEKGGEGEVTGVLRWWWKWKCRGIGRLTKVNLRDTVMQEFRSS